MESLCLSKSIVEIADDIRNKRISVTEIIKEALDRIDSFDHFLNSFITVNPNALGLAKEADKQIADGHYKGPLHGIPIGLKDMIDTDNMKTTMGSEIFKDYIPEQDAFTVSQLKNAGAIVIGKLNTHQFAYGPTGDRSYYGPIHNPYDLSRMAGGSSGGSAAAVSAGFCYGALGTDTSGSIRVPASFCGIVGMKPTNGLVSQKGIFPLAESLDSTGPMTKNINDNAILMNVLQSQGNEDFTRLVGHSIKGITIGIPDSFFFKKSNQHIECAIKKAVNTLQSLGANLTKVRLSHMEEFSEAQKVIIRYEARRIHGGNLREYPDRWDDEVKERLTTHIPTHEDYLDALKTQLQSKEDFRKVLDRVDALVTPTMSILPPKINERYIGSENGENRNEDTHIRWSITKLTAPTNLAGLPSLTLPCGSSSAGMPIGIQLIGREFDEALLYQIGYALEQALGLDLSVVDI